MLRRPRAPGVLSLIMLKKFTKLIALTKHYFPPSQQGEFSNGKRAEPQCSHSRFPVSSRLHAGSVAVASEPCRSNLSLSAVLRVPRWLSPWSGAFRCDCVTREPGPISNLSISPPWPTPPVNHRTVAPAQTRNLRNALRNPPPAMLRVFRIQRVPTCYCVKVWNGAAAPLSCTTRSGPRARCPLPARIARPVGSRGASLTLSPLIPARTCIFTIMYSRPRESAGAHCPGPRSFSQWGQARNMYGVAHSPPVDRLSSPKLISRDSTFIDRTTRTATRESYLFNIAHGGCWHSRCTDAFHGCV